MWLPCLSAQQRGLTCGHALPGLGETALQALEGWYSCCYSTPHFLEASFKPTFRVTVPLGMNVGPPCAARAGE